jgi:CheY-like chemotaxis protein/Tfp pilus assembly protein PilF
MLDLRSKNILLIEDYPAMRKAIRDMLYSLEVESLVEAENGQKAIVAMQNHKFDIVLCDYNLGTGKNGLQVLEEARFRKLLPSYAAFIMVTAEQVQSMVLSAMENKPDEYLTKPFTAQLLLTRLKRTFERKGFFKKVDAAIDSENYALAIKFCDQLLIESPKKLRTAALKKRAELAISTHDYPTAQHIYQDILEQRELNWAMLGLAQIQYLQGNSAEAISIFQEIINKYPMTMEAYDLLAQSYELTDQNAKAQETLNKAVALSPQTILRHRKLAAIANKTGNLEIAESACKSAVELGKYSVHKHSSDFSNLAQVFNKSEKPDDALAILQSMRAEFPDDPSTALRAAIHEAEIFKSTGDSEKAEEAFVEALELTEHHKQNLDKEILLDMTKACYLNEHEHIADAFLEQLVKNHVDDEFINDINAMHSAVGRENHAEELINTTKKQLIHINNEGVKLYKQGKFAEAVALFATAFKSMPNNKTIILNMTKIMLHDIQASGCTKENMTEVKYYINKAKKLGVAPYKLNTIQMEYAKLALNFKNSLKKG